MTARINPIILDITFMIDWLSLSAIFWLSMNITYVIPHTRAKIRTMSIV